MDQLCLELDDLAIQYSDTLDELAEVKQRMQNAMRQGFFNLTKTRNSMGKGQVGALQFDYSRMRAQAHIQISELENGQIYSFQLEHEHMSELNTAKTSKRQHEGETTQTPVRTDDISASHEQVPLSTDTANLEEDRGPLPDPLRWFGILVPSTLRHSQSNFIHALHECSQLASLQNQLLVIRHQYMILKIKKNQLKNATY